MKLIDEKGRLFKIINIIDLFVLIVLIVVIGAVGYKFLGKKIITSSASTSKEVTFVVKCSLKNESAGAALKAGDKILSLTDVAPNTSVESVTITPGDYTTVTSEGQMKLTKHPFLKDIYVTIKTKFDPSSTSFKLGIQDVAVGKEFEVKTQKANIRGVIDGLKIN